MAVKPMSCPGAIQYYLTKKRSYKELPLRVAEFGTDHRLEQSGELQGLFRTRRFVQDGAHIFLHANQLKGEIVSLLGFIDKIYRVFGLTYRVELSTRGKDSIGSDEYWVTSTEALRGPFIEKGIRYDVEKGKQLFTDQK